MAVASAGDRRAQSVAGGGGGRAVRARAGRVVRSRSRGLGDRPADGAARRAVRGAVASVTSKRAAAACSRSRRRASGSTPTDASVSVEAAIDARRGDVLWSRGAVARVRPALAGRRARAARWPSQPTQRRDGELADRHRESLVRRTGDARPRSSASSADRCTGSSTRARSSARPRRHLSMVVERRRRHCAARQRRRSRPLAARQMTRRCLRLARRAELVRSVVVREHARRSRSTPGAPPRPATRTPVAGLYLAGDWTDTGLPGTIEGAVLSGHRAADAAACRDADSRCNRQSHNLRCPPSSSTTASWR